MATGKNENGKGARDKRLAEALRANLKRRRGQQKARDDENRDKPDKP